MSLLSWVIYLAIGKVLIFLGMAFPLPKLLEEKKTIKYLHECDLCFGVWVYMILAAFMHMDLLSVLGFLYVPVISEVVTGCCVSFLVHLISLGWIEKFSVVELD